MIGVLSLVLASCATMPTPQEASDAVLTLRQYEHWAWAVGMALIWADLVLPVLSSAKIDFSRQLLFSRYELQFAWEPIRFHSSSQFSDASSRSIGLGCDENDSRFRSPSLGCASGL
jgi:hypothetical protein